MHATSTIPTARAGFDKLVLSLRPADAGAFFRQVIAQPPALAGYRPASGPLAAEGAYRHLYQYSSTSPRRPDVDLLYAPEQHSLPAAQLALRASIADLITRRGAACAVLHPLTTRFAGTSNVSLAELAIDFPMTPAVHAAICGEAYGPWTRKAHWYDTTYYLTTAAGVVCVRIYPKQENDISVLRAELVLRRRFFHRHGVTAVGDLASGGWFDAAQRALRFVRYRPTPRRSIAENERILGLITALGVNEALRHYPGDPQRIRRRLVPTDHDRLARAALARFRRGL